MPGLNQQHDVEVAEVQGESDEFDLTPLTPKGVLVLSEYLGRQTEKGVPIRVTDRQYRGLNEYTYERNDHYKGFSIGMRQTFLGQRQADQSDLDWPSDPVLPQELLDRLSFGRGIHLKDHNFTVSVGRYGTPPQGPLFKVTKTKHVPAQSLSVSLGTLHYYRNTTDKHEASFESSGRGVSIHDMAGKELVGPEAEVHRTIAMDPCWIYCTTQVGRGFEADQLAWLDGNHAATPIVTPVNHFARMLGANFGLWSKPRIREVYRWLESVEQLRYTMNGIMVLHGPVRYMDAAERNDYLKTLSRERSPIEMHENVFTKNDEFSWEREYRFGIWGWGPPLQDHVLMRLDGELFECYGRSLQLQAA